MKKRLLTSVFLILLLAGVFLIIAEDIGVTNQNVDSVESVSLDSSEVEILDENEIKGVIPELEKTEIPEEVIKMEKRARLGISRVSVGEGFIINNDETNADFFRGVWILKRFVEKSDSKDVENEEVVSRSFGFIVLGVRNEKEKFKLEKVENNKEEEISFNLIDKNKEVVGSLDLKPKRYERVVLWFGDLSLDSGYHVGEWKVSAVVKTRIVKPRIKRPPMWQFWKFKERKEANLKEKAQEKLFEREGLGEFIKKNMRKDLNKISDDKKRIIVNRKKFIAKEKERIRERKEGLKEKRTRINEIIKEKRGE